MMKVFLGSKEDPRVLDIDILGTYMRLPINKRPQNMNPIPKKQLAPCAQKPTLWRLYVITHAREAKATERVCRTSSKIMPMNFFVPPWLGI